MKLRTPFDQENSSLNSNHENGFRQKKKLRDHIPVISRKDRNVAVTQPTQPAQSVISKQEEIKNKAIVTEEIITSANHNEIENNSITKKEESLLITDSAQERIALYNKSINPLVTPIDSSNNNTNAPFTVQEVKKQKQVHWKWGLTSSVGGTRIAREVY